MWNYIGCDLYSNNTVLKPGFHRGVETILKVEGHDSYEVRNGGPGVYPRKKFLQTTPFKLRENDTTPSYYA